MRTAVVGALAIGGVVAIDGPAAELGRTASADGPSGVEIIEFEAPRNQHILLGNLASRTQQKPVTISGIAPTYTVRGTDSRSGELYEFITDFFYNPNATNNGPGNFPMGDAWAREGDERALSGTWSWTSQTMTYDGRPNVLQLKSSGTCVSNPTGDGANMPNGIPSYCSAFGPEVYSKPFSATVGQAVSFDWAALRVADDYEVYAFLVDVTGLSGDAYLTAGPERHTLLAYGRGHTQGWTTTSRNVIQDGTYRFRFVNGSYDQTGGYWLGSEMYIDNVIRVGQANPITFDPLPDRVMGTDVSFEVAATAPGGAVTFSTTTPQRCSVSGSTVSLVNGQTGVCTIIADQAGDGVTYVPAESLPRSFTILAAPTVPSNNGLPFVTGTLASDQTLTAHEGSWADGGSPILSTTFQWRVTNGGSTNDIVGLTGDSCYVVPEAGSQISVAVTKTNAQGSTTAVSSLQGTGFTCGEPQAPTWDDQTIVTSMQTGVAYSDGVSANGIPAPTYSVTDGALPAGLTLNSSTGAITGTPTAPGGPFSVTITATNGEGAVHIELSGVVNSAPQWVDSTLPQLVVGTPVDVNLGADGYPLPTYSVTDGELPDGLSLDHVTGRVHGTPTTAGPFDATVTASNGIGNVDSVGLAGVVHQVPVWQPGTSLGTLQVDVAVEVTLTATGTPAPTYSVTAGTLPAGLELDPSSGSITGTPTTPGAYSVTISATNVAGAPVPLELSGVITAPSTWDEPAPLGDLQRGVVVDWSEPASGTPAPTYTVTAGVLPAGLELDPTTGQVSGTPTGSGPYGFTITAHNGVGEPVSIQFSGVVNDPPAWVGPQTVPVPEVGQGYHAQLQVSGYPAPTFAVTAGKLPAGLSLDAATGVLGGTPTSATSYEFTITASNGIGDPVTLTRTGHVQKAPGWSKSSLPQLVVGAAVDTVFVAGGYPLPTYSVTTGALPAGISLNSTTGRIHGTPTTAGPFSATITASNGVGTSATVVVSGTVHRSSWWLDASFTAPALGEAVAVQLVAGGTPTPTYSVTAGALPAGLKLDAATGRIQGTVTAPGPYSFTVTAGNGVGSPVSRTFSGVVQDEAEAEIDIDLSIGARVSNSEITVRVYGMKPHSPVRIELHSDPVLLGVRNADARGDLVATVGLPSYVSPGTHHVVVQAISPLGESVTAQEPLVVDWSGARAPSVVDGGYVPIEPVRVVDTRSGEMLRAGETRELDTTRWTSAAGASAVTVNVTAVDTGAAGYLVVHGCASEDAGSSLLNFGLGQTVANLALLAVDASGKLCVTSTADAHLLVDLNGVHRSDEGVGFEAVDPDRLVDTRTGSALSAGDTLRVPVPAGTDAAAINLTVDQPSGSGYLTAHPCGIDRPAVSNLNFTAGRTVANQAHVSVGEDAICVFTSVETHVIVDLVGVFGDDGDLALGTSNPARVLETRYDQILVAGTPRTITIDGAPTGTRAVSVNLTATDATAPGYLTVHDCSGPLSTSNLNFFPGRTTANHAIVELGADGEICVESSVDTHVLVDVQGTWRTRD